MKEYIIASNRPFTNRDVATPKELTHILRTKRVTTIFFPFWSWKVPKEIVNNYECIGFHSSPLPRGKGGSPIQNMIRLGYDSTPLHMFRLTEGMDEGESLNQRIVPLDGTLSKIVSRISCEIESMIEGYLEGYCYSYTNPDEYNDVPPHFDRIASNYLPESDTARELYNEIRMRDEKDHPKTHVYLGKWKIEFTKARLLDGEVTTNARIFQG